MKKYAMRGAGKTYTSLAIITVTVLLSSVLVVPSSNAYALSQNGNSRAGNSGLFNVFFSLFGNSLGNHITTTFNQSNADDQGDAKGKGDSNGKAVGGGDEKNEKSDRKELKDKKEDQHNNDKCKPNKQGKYNKDCREDQNEN